MLTLLSINWNPNPELFNLFGSLPIRYYGLLWVVGIALAYVIVHRQYHDRKIDEKTFEPLFFYCFFGILIGARLGHCLFYQPDYYLNHFWEMILPVKFLPDGGWKFTGYEGLASHGGTLGLIIALWMYCRKTKMHYMDVLDMIAVATPVTACCIRLANLMNSEIFGYPTTLPWGFEFVRSREWQELYNQNGVAQACHPTQIYEMLYCLVALVVSWFMYHKLHLGKRIGLTTGVSLLIFFGARFGLEFMKNPQVAEEVGMTLNIGQWLSVPLILLGIYLIATSGKRKEAF